MRFARNSYITWFLKLSFRVHFRKPFRDLPDTFRDSAFSHFLCFLCFFGPKNYKRCPQKTLMGEPWN